MNFRHEIKHEISYSDMLVIRQRLRAVAKPDSHAVNGRYFIRSLYFDNLTDKALREKLDGVNSREKFRIRCYNNDFSLIHLEKKSKLNGLGSKQSAELTADEVKMIVSGDTGWMLESERPLVQELYSKMKTQGLKPKTIVDYTREPFVYPTGNVRVTLDYDIRTGILSTDFFNAECLTVPVKEQAVVMEVKWDEFLPSVIKDAIQLDGRRSTAFSKYAVCRVYG